MIDWFDYRVTATPWSLMVATQQSSTWLEKAIARAGHMDYWWKVGGCGVCKREAVYPMRPPFCDQCWRNRIVQLTTHPETVVPVTISFISEEGMAYGRRYDRHEIGKLPVLENQYIQTTHSDPYPQLDDHDE